MRPKLVILALLPLLLFAVVAEAQNGVDYVYHVYVDPLFGDNDQANANNPQTLMTGAVRPLDPHPDSSNSGITGYIQHAPYAFRNVAIDSNGTFRGALGYVFNLVRTTATGSLPWPHPSGRRISHVVIHCLPGLYGPLFGPSQDPTDPINIDPASGLPYNGEVFPIPFGLERVSLQGTSALDTIFDARGTEVDSIIEVQDLGGSSFPSCPGGASICYGESFIDSITFRRARTDPITTWTATRPASGWPRGSAILIGGYTGSNTAPIAITISNCMIYDNFCGICIDAAYLDPPGGSPRQGDHSPRIVNNTIAWNFYGIWAGNASTPDIQSSGPPGYTNQHTPLIVNNIIDPLGPWDPATGFFVDHFYPTVSCFEGLDGSDLTVASRGPTPTTGQLGINQDFNAWDSRLFDVGTQRPQLPPSWKYAQPGVGPAMPSPRVDLAAFGPVIQGPLGGPFEGRRSGSLYLNDMFRNGIGGGMMPFSGHDFRLAVAVSDQAGVPPGNLNPLILNPMVQMGIDGGPNQTENIYMVHGSLCVPAAGPGIPAGTAAGSMTGWDWDCEGFGNQRVDWRSGFPPVPDPGFGIIDLGADEMGEILMAGYARNTRIFTPNNVPNAQVGDHALIYFFNVPGGSFPRPSFNAVFSQVYDWYDHIQLAPDAVQGTNYTNGGGPGVPTPNARLVMTAGQWAPLFMRNLECDFSPSLLIDIHPEWGQRIADAANMASGGGFSADPYASNPWYTTTSATNPPFQLQLDNPALYNNLAVGPHTTAVTFPIYRVVNTADFEGTLNPPGTWRLPTIPPGQLGGTRFLYVTGQPTTFGPFSPCTQSTYTPGPWGFNDLPAGCPDRLPALDLRLGVRCNVELPYELHPTGAGWSNLQTFLAIMSESSPQQQSTAGAGNLATPTSTGFGNSPSLSDTDRAMRLYLRSLGF